MRNIYGNIFTLTSFGESHGEAVGGVVDGMPAGIDIDLDFIQAELDRRRPGQSAITTSRKEADKFELLSGVFEGKSTGCPIGFVVRKTMRICATCSAPPMPTIHIRPSTASVIIVAADARRRASQYRVAWREHSQNWL